MAYTITYNSISFEVGKKFAISHAGDAYEPRKYTIICQAILHAATETAFKTIFVNAIAALSEPCESFSITIDGTTLISWSQTADDGKLSCNADYATDDMKGLCSTGVNLTVNFTKNVAQTKEAFDFGDYLITSDYDEAWRRIITVNRRFHTTSTDADTEAQNYYDNYSTPTGFTKTSLQIAKDDYNRFATLSFVVKENEFTYPDSDIVDMSMRLSRTIVNAGAENYMIQTMVAGEAKIRKSAMDTAVTKPTDIYDYNDIIMNEVLSYMGGNPLYMEDYFFEYDFKARTVTFGVRTIEGMIPGAKQIMESDYSITFDYQAGKSAIPLMDGNFYFQQTDPPFMIATISGNIKKINDDQYKITVPNFEKNKDLELLDGPRVEQRAPIYINNNAVIYSWTVTCTVHIHGDKIKEYLSNNAFAGDAGEKIGIKSLFPAFKLAKTNVAIEQWAGNVEGSKPE